MNALDLNVSTAVQQYLDENGFTVEEYTRPYVDIGFGPYTLKLRNGPARQRAIPLHDMHHVATGYGTDLAGEAEVGMWELRAGCNNAFLWLINLAAVTIGAVIAPWRVLRAFRRARGARSLYVSGRSPEELAALTVGELRRLVGVPENGVAEPAERRLHGRAPVKAHAS
jgi:hypothetical protein